MISEENPKRLAQVALVALLIIGCIAVLLPFIGAVLFAFVVWICTWSLYSERLLPWLGGRHSLAASLMTLLLILVMLLPMIFLTGSLISNGDLLVDELRPHFQKGLPVDAPDLLKGLPIVGAEIESNWHRVASNRAEFNALLNKMAVPARNFALGAGKVAFNGLLQLALVLFLLFFLYRDGKTLAVIAYGRIYVRGADAKADTRAVAPEIKLVTSPAWSASKARHS